jgi:hypothetical protein
VFSLSFRVRALRASAPYVAGAPHAFELGLGPVSASIIGGGREHETESVGRWMPEDAGRGSDHGRVHDDRGGGLRERCPRRRVRDAADDEFSGRVHRGNGGEPDGATGA